MLREHIMSPSDPSFRLTNEEYRDILMNAPMGIFTFTPEGKILGMNPAFVSMFGYDSPQELINSVEDIGRQLYIDPEARKEMMNYLEKREEELKVESCFIRKDGSLFWAANNIRVVKDEIENILYYQGFLTDITELKQHEKMLQESGKKYRFLTEEASDTIWTLGMDMKPTYVSPNSFKVLGFTPEERLNQHLSEMVTPETYSRVMDVLTRELEKEQKGNLDPDRTVAIEMEYYHKDGHTLWLENKVRAIRDSEGKIVGLYGMSRDITDRKKVEDALKERDALFKKLSSHVPGMIYQFVKRPDGTYCVPLSTDAIKDIFGCSPEDVREDFSPIMRVILPEDLDKLIASIESSARHMTPWRCEYRVQLPGQSIRWMFGQSTPEKMDDGTIIWYGFNANITEHKKIKETLSETEARLHKLSDNLPDGFVYQIVVNMKNQERRFVYLSAGVELVSGVTADEALNNPMLLYEQVVEDDRPLLDKREDLALAELSPMHVEVRIKVPSGQIKWISINSAPRLLSDDTTIWDGITLDITSRKQAEFHREAVMRELQHEKKFNENLIQKSPAFFVAISIDGKTIMMNESLLRALGYTEEEVEGKDYLTTFIPKLERKLLSKLFEQLISTGQPLFHQTTVLTKEGEKLLVEWHEIPVFKENTELDYFFGFGIDITEQTRMEQELKESFAKLRLGLRSTVRAIAETVEARDPYTAGHQRRVSDLGRAIATEMKLSKDKIEGIRTAGTLHDVGKISVPVEILSKPIQLTDLEFSIIKTHPQSGYDILKNIDFPWPLARMILEHHELIDGSGYPNGLTGDELLVESKILVVADVVEAMASHRPYRPAWGIDIALEEIRKNKGVLYDPDIVDACLRLFNKEGYRLPE